jgi:hypothetical protein
VGRFAQFSVSGMMEQWNVGIMGAICIKLKMALIRKVQGSIKDPLWERLSSRDHSMSGLPKDAQESKNFI